MVLTTQLLALLSIWTGKAMKFVVPPCDQQLFDSSVNKCLSDFHKTMETSGFQHSCPWPAVKSNYNNLKYCVDNWANVSWCKGHGSLVDEVFLKVHDMYFLTCEHQHDPPLSTCMMLIAPVVIATLLMPLICIKLTSFNAETFFS